MVTASAGMLAAALAQRPFSFSVMAVVALVAFLSRRSVLPRMDRLRARDEPMEAPAIRQFRELHILGMLLNFAQLLAICVSLAKFGV